MVIRATADALRPYIGRWVAVRAGVVVYDGDSVRDVVGQLRAASETADSLFRVPVDPAADDYLCTG